MCIHLTLGSKTGKSMLFTELGMLEVLHSTVRCLDKRVTQATGYLKPYQN